jgi:hypothetical protein
MVFREKRLEREVLRAPRRRAAFARGWRRLLARARSSGTPWNSADNTILPGDGNLQLRGPLAQSHRRICFIPDDEGIVVLVCVADTLSGLEPGSAAQLLELWFSFVTRAPALLFSSVARIHPGNNRILRHSSLRQLTDNKLRQNAVPSTRATPCSPTTTNLRQHAVRPTRASLSSAKPRK